MPLLDDANLQLQGPVTEPKEEQTPGTIEVVATQLCTMTIAEYNNYVRASKVPLFDWANMVWETEIEPPIFFDKQGNQTKGPLLHLYTVTGFLLIGYWPEDEPIGRHFVSWAYVDEDLSPEGETELH